MANRRTLTPAQMARQSAVPEENPEYVNDPWMALLAPLMVYGSGAAELGPALRAAQAARARTEAMNLASKFRTTSIREASGAAQRRLGSRNFSMATPEAEEAARIAAMESEGGMGMSRAEMLAAREEAAAAERARIDAMINEGGSAPRYWKFGELTNPAPREAIPHVPPGVPATYAPRGTAVAGRVQPGSDLDVARRVFLNPEEANLAVGPRTVGGQSANQGSAGPWYSSGSANYPRATAAPMSSETSAGIAALAAAHLAAQNREPSIGPYSFDYGREATAPQHRDTGMPNTQLPNLGMMPSHFVPSAPVEEAPAAPPTRAPERRAPAAAPAREAPTPPRRPAELSPAERSFLARLFSGPEYQSTGQRVVDNGRVNWGDADSAADFARASRAMQQQPPDENMARGGVPNGDMYRYAMGIINRAMRG
jgi:hypothetical protein